MKFKKSHTVDTMIVAATKEVDGYFQLHYPGTDDTLAVQVYGNAPRCTVQWLRKPEGTKRFVRITRSAAISLLDNWRKRE